MKKLKYEEEISKIASDFSKFRESEIISYRWTFEKIENPLNFLPVYIQDPDRKKYDDKKNKTTSLGYALSLYSSKEGGIKKYNKILADKPKAFLKLGTHIACGKLETTDGINDEVNKEEHFSHFEYENVNLQDKFEIIEKLVK